MALTTNQTTGNDEANWLNPFSSNTPGQYTGSGVNNVQQEPDLTESPQYQQMLQSLAAQGQSGEKSLASQESATGSSVPSAQIDPYAAQKAAGLEGVTSGMTEADLKEQENEFQNQNQLALNQYMMNYNNDQAANQRNAQLFGAFMGTTVGAAGTILGQTSNTPQYTPMSEPGGYETSGNLNSPSAMYDANGLPLQNNGLSLQDQEDQEDDPNGTGSGALAAIMAM